MTNYHALLLQLKMKGSAWLLDHINDTLGFRDLFHETLMIIVVATGLPFTLSPKTKIAYVINLA